MDEGTSSLSGVAGKNILLETLDSTAPIFDNILRDKKVSVIGAGAFGTAIATVAARAGHQVMLYARREAVVASINLTHINPDYLSRYTLSDLITASSDLETTINFCDILILAIPAQLVPVWLGQHKRLIPPGLLICNTAKGLYLEDKVLLSEAILKALGRDQPYALLSGPSFASEIMDGAPTAVVVASKYLYHAVTIQRMMSSLIFRCYASQDLIGVELGGALKNPLAIGAGMIEGMGLGINSMAAYVTMSSNELQLLCKAMGGESQTISGLAGVIHTSSLKSIRLGITPLNVGG
jgi:glycerol-3-phosphate dehydrogenase (NAD+)